MADYRDDRRALAARVEDLEQRLADSESQVDRLEGRGRHRSESAPRAPGRSKISGGPKATHLFEVLPFELSDEGYVALAALYDDRLTSKGRASQVGRVLTVRGTDGELRVSPAEGGGTLIEMRASHQVLPVLQLGLGGIMTVGAAAIAQGLGVPAEMFLLGLATSALPLWLMSRPLAQRYIRHHQRVIRGYFEAAIDVAKAHRVKPEVRVAAVDDSAEFESVELAEERAEDDRDASET